MSITYNNPDEVVKVKHILSLAEHIADKIDGSGSSSSSASKTTPTLSASKTTYSLADFTATGMIYLGGASTLTYNGDGDFVVEPNTGINIMVYSSNGNVVIEPYYIQTHAPTVPVTFKVGFTETANYKACSVDITVTA